MPLEIHTIEVLDGGFTFNSDRVILGVQCNLAHGSAAANTAVTTTVTFSQELPSPNYVVQVESDQAVTCFVQSKTSTGFQIVLTPVTTGQAISAGTMDVLVIA